MAKLGPKGYDKNMYGKLCEPRHKNRARAGAKREERRIEKAVRRAGKAACQDY